jgi:biopolymer transport protein ExbB/TolQ
MTEPMPSADLLARISAWAQRTYVWHLSFFVGFNVLLTALNVWTGKSWWALWPLVITGGLFLIHFLIYKTSLVDDEWVDERAGDIYSRSYDMGHINSIADRHDMETVAQKNERVARERHQKEQRELIRQMRQERQRQTSQSSAQSQRSEND